MMKEQVLAIFFLSVQNGSIATQWRTIGVYSWRIRYCIIIDLLLDDPQKSLLVSVSGYLRKRT